MSDETLNDESYFIGGRILAEPETLLERLRRLDAEDNSIEHLSAKFHAIYQAEARRQAGTGDDTVRHPDDYDALPEHTKEYDRVLARYVLDRERRFLDALPAILRVIEAARALLGETVGGGIPDYIDTNDSDPAFVEFRDALAALATPERD